MNRFIVLAITLASLAGFGYTLVHALYIAPEQGNFMPTTTPVVTSNRPAEEPSRLVIPAIGVDANIQYVGVNAKGNMGVPNNFTDVAWYKYGTAPGERGSAVIDGHVDNGLALPGVFKHLDAVKIGDGIEVSTKEGSALRFAVDEIDTYPMDAVPLDKVFNRDDTARLVLITCTGAWVKEAKTYDTRLVVYAHLVAP